jgi:hypothetical protein
MDARSLGLKAKGNKMAGPASVRNVTVTIDGVTYNGTFHTHGSMVYVQYGDARRIHGLAD